jgi:hypothetical protein
MRDFTILICVSAKVGEWDLDEYKGTEKEGYYEYDSK